MAPTEPMDPSWMLRIHMEVSDPLSIFSNHMPAKPERKHAATTAEKPSTGLPTDVAATALFEKEGAWTRAMPATRRQRANHLTGRILLPSIVTAKSAVVSTLSWYVIWQVAASRLLVAMKRRLFCTMYTKAGTATLRVMRQFTKTSWYRMDGSFCLCWSNRMMRHVPTLITSDDTTAVEAKYGIEEILMREYRMLSIWHAFCITSSARTICLMGSRGRGTSAAPGCWAHSAPRCAAAGSAGGGWARRR
mmetsp:Transcript_25489/g.59060  ORF Transcript_25489/g.59060 Transcript_25489/m.59060 type:complete len:248 (+) Transcript_25489:324-1067(+)